MFVSTIIPALLLLASAMPAMAQESSEGLLTIQTMEVSGSATATSEGQMSIPAGETPITDPILSSIHMPIPTTGPILTLTGSATGEMSIPAGETPLSTGLSSVPEFTSPITGATSEGTSGGSTPSASGSAPPQQSTAAAAPGPLGNGNPALVAAALSGLCATLGFAWVLL